jgi:regulator of sigma E protease
VSWFLAFAGFAALIILHEAGHFAAAKAVGMRVERFFLFFPPKLFSKRIGETEYGVGAIPLGGFVKITGMNPDELEPRPAEAEEGRTRPDLLTRLESADSGPETPPAAEGPEPLPPEVLERGYYRQPVWKRIVVIGAGPAVNIVIAFLILFFLAFGAEQATSLVVDRVEEGTPAAAALEPGDRLISIDGVRADPGDLEASAERLSDQINSHTCRGERVPNCRAATPVRVVIERDGERKVLLLRPFFDPDTDRNRLGFGFAGGDPEPLDLGSGGAASRALDQMWFVSSTTVEVIARIFETEQREQISGVVGSYEVTRQAIGFGAREALTLLAVISLSLGLLNLFPFLPLDGGHIFWSLVEKVRGRPVPFSVMERASVVGFALVLMLFFIGLSNDIGRLTGDGFDVR